MTFRTDNQPNHDRAKSALMGDSPWRRSTTVYRAERFADARRERHIKALSRRISGALKAGDKDTARMLDAERVDAIKARSHGQVRRMERAKGLTV